MIASQTEDKMRNIDLARKFYSLPRITKQDRIDLLSMFHQDVCYVGVGKESARGRDAIERLFSKYEARGNGITAIQFDIKHIAENGNTVLIDMVDTITVGDRKMSGVWSIVFEFENELIAFWQEHYPIADVERLFAQTVPVTESESGPLPAQ
jgi:limonene-1,2-epoxide hydrolase